MRFSLGRPDQPASRRRAGSAGREGKAIGSNRIRRIVLPYVAEILLGQIRPHAPTTCGVGFSSLSPLQGLNGLWHVVHSQWGELVGFENHSGLTMGCLTGAVGRVKVGRGNNGSMDRRSEISDAIGATPWFVAAKIRLLPTADILVNETARPGLNSPHSDSIERCEV